MRVSKARTGAACDATKAACGLLVGLLMVAPAGFAQQADGFDAQWARTTSGAQTSTSANGEFSADGTIGVSEGSSDTAAADVFEADPGYVAGLIPPNVTLKPNVIFDNNYE